MVSLFSNKFKSLTTDRFIRISATSDCIIKLLASLFLILSGCMISSADAQINRVEVGDRVRITAPFVDPMERIKGTISEMSGSVLVLAKEDSLIYISDSLIQTMEVSTGKKRVIGEGLLLGAVAGTVLFGAVAAIFNDACSPAERDCSSSSRNGDAFVSAGKIGLIAGTAAGALTGFFVKIDDWERTPVRIGVGVSPARKSVDQWAVEPTFSLKFPIGK